MDRQDEVQTQVASNVAVSRSCDGRQASALLQQRPQTQTEATDSIVTVLLEFGD